MRRIEFKMERPGLLEVGQKITVTEGLLPSNYYYTIDPSLAMSPNIPFRYRLKNREGVVADIVENSRGFYVTAEFDEPEVDMTKYTLWICRTGFRYVPDEVVFSGRKL